MKLWLVITINYIIGICTIQYDYWTKDGAYSISLSWGTPAQKQQKVINQIIPISLSSTWYYQRNTSTSFHIINETIDNSINPFRIDLINASLSSDLLMIIKPKMPEICIQNFTFIYINYNYYDSIIIQNPISFAYSFSNHSHSFIHQLFNQGSIQKLTYSFIPETQYFGKFYLGENPLNKAINYSSASCDIDTKQTYWSCQLNYVIMVFNNNNDSTNHNFLSYIHNDKIIFQAAQKLITAPKAFMKWINVTLFDKFFEVNECNMFYLYKELHYKCLCDVVQFFPTIMEIIINSYSFKLSNNSLFRKDGRYCEFQIAFNEDSSDTWVLGASFLNKYISTFDYEKGKVLFYSNNSFASDYEINQVINLNQFNKNTIKWFNIAIIICCFLPLLLLINQLMFINKYYFNNLL